MEATETVEIVTTEPPKFAHVPSGITSWVGGKATQLTWLLPLIPYSKTYVEPFGGSAAVLLARKHSNTEIYNDLDGWLVNLFRVCQRPASRKRLLDMLENTLYSRAELAKALEIYHNGNGDSVHNAWAFFVMTNQMFGANTDHQVGSWGYSLNDSYSQPKRWMSRIARLPKIIQRIKSCYIEQEDGINCIKRYDSPTTVFYCDPPYVLSSRKDRKVYAHECSDDFHVNLIQTLRAVKGAVVLSGYHNDLYDVELANWHLNEHKTTASLAGRVRGNKTYGVGNVTKFASRTECVWRNARAMELSNDNLFVGRG